MPLQREQWLDPSGRAPLATVERQDFSALPPSWHTVPVGQIRWERLTLAAVPPRTDLVLYVRMDRSTRLTLFYPPQDTACGHWPMHDYPDAASELALSRWFAIPVCPGARTLYLRHATQRAPAPTVELRTRIDAEVQNFLYTGRVYAMSAVAFIALMVGLVGAVRYRDRLWTGVAVRLLLSSPYLLRGSSAPAEAPMAPLVSLFARIDADQLLALATLGHTLFEFAVSGMGAASSAHRPRRWRRWLDWAPSAVALVALGTAVWAPYPHGQWLALLATLLGLPCGLLGVWLNRSPRSPTTTGADRRHESWLEALLVIVATIPVVLFHIPALWTALPFTIAIFLVVVALLVAVRAGNRRTAAAAALFAEKLARQRSEDQAREQLERREETRDLMLMLTHEIRTPLAVLRISTEQASRSPAAQERVHQSIAEMDRLIERCMETARLDGDKDEAPVADWVPAVELAEIAALSRVPERVRVTTPANLTAAGSRPTVINAIAAILVDNALRYGATDHPVDMAARAAVAADGQPGLAISVTNRIGANGAPDESRLFRKYYRGIGAHRHSGAGLGLYLASRLAERLRGRLTHSSNDTETRFELWIPR